MLIIITISSKTLAEKQTVVIKKYPNRRLYNTESSKYITLDDLSELVKQDYNFKVIDVKTNEDVTRIILTQIILEHEMQGYSLLSEEFLKQLIKFYNHPMNKIFSSYMTQSLAQFNHNSTDFQKLFSAAKMPTSPNEWAKMFEELGENNAKMFQNLFKNPFEPKE